MHIISEPMAAAIGAGLPVNQAFGSMIVDIGGGTTEVAVLALGGVVASTSLRVAGNALDDAIVDHVRDQFSLLIGERTAEELKINLGSAFPVAGPQTAEIRGRDIGSGLPRNVTISTDELRKAMDVPLTRIVGAVRSTLDRCPPEIAGDLVTRGIVVTGGGALLRGLAARLQHDIGIPVLVADRPLDSVVLGTGTVVEHFEQLHKVVVDGPAGSADGAVASWWAADQRHRLTRRQRLAAVALIVIAAGFIALDLTGSSLAEAHSGARGVLGSLYRGSDSVLGPVRRYLQALPGAGARLGPGRASSQAQNAQLNGQLAADAADAQTSAELAKLQLAAGTAGLTDRGRPGHRVRPRPGLRLDGDHRRRHQQRRRRRPDRDQRRRTGRPGAARRCIHLGRPAGGRSRLGRRRARRAQR